MLILVEGADGTGKSTLINQLKHIEKMLFISGKDVPRDFPGQSDIWHWESMNALTNKSKVLFDRSYLSELVYRSVLKDKKPTISLQDIIHLLQYVGTIIYCKTNNSFDLAQKRGEDYITSERVHNKIVKMYDNVIDIIKTFNLCNVIEYDFSKENVEDVINKINNLGGSANESGTV